MNHSTANVDPLLAGHVSINEFRAARGLPPLEQPDVVAKSKPWWAAVTLHHVLVANVIMWVVILIVILSR